METKRVKCPKCSKKLEVANKNQESVLLVRCPQCNAKMRVKFDTGETVLADAEDRSEIIGLLKNGDKYYRLHEGVNILGRKVTPPQADVSIETDDLTMSRKHAAIEIVRLKSNKVKAVLGDLRTREKAGIKPIFHEEIPLDADDRVVVCFGDTIQLGNTILKYVQEM